MRKAEDAIFKDENLNHEYLGQLGMESFTQLATKMLLGEDSPALKEQRAFGVQSLSGTGALRIGSEFLKKCAGFQTVYVSKPSWRMLYSKFVLSHYLKKLDLQQIIIWC